MNQLTSCRDVSQPHRREFGTGVEITGNLLLCRSALLAHPSFWPRAAALLLAGLVLGQSTRRPALAAEPTSGSDPAPSTNLLLSREDALRLGLRRSLGLRGSALTVAENRSLLELSRTRFRPTIDLVALGSFAQVGTEIGFISNLPTIGDLSLNLRGNNSAVINNAFINAGVVLNLPLLDFGRMPLRREAEAGLEAALASEREDLRRVRFEILGQYLTAQWTAALIPAWERALTASRRLESDATALRREGLAARIDTFQAHALVQADLQGLAEAQAQHRIALSALARGLDLPAELAISLRDPLTADAAWDVTLAESIRLALNQRPALESLQRQRQAQLARLDLARAGRKPTLGLLVGAGLSGDWLDIQGQKTSGRLDGSDSGGLPLPTINNNGSASGGFYDWGAALTLRQPLYDGGQTRLSIDLAQQRTERADLAIAQAEQLIIQSVETWYSTHQAAGPQAEAARAAIAAGEASVRDAEIRYRAGLAPITEMLVAQRNLQLARSAEATAIYRWNLSRAGLERETGLGDAGPSPSSGPPAATDNPDQPKRSCSAPTCDGRSPRSSGSMAARMRSADGGQPGR
jgi:outer membrane protein TolC